MEAQEEKDGLEHGVVALQEGKRGVRTENGVKCPKERKKEVCGREERTRGEFLQLVRSSPQREKVPSSSEEDRHRASRGAPTSKGLGSPA